MFCPNLSDPKIKEQFTRLENLHPDLAYYLWDKYQGEVPAKYYNIPSTSLFQLKDDSKLEKNVEKLDSYLLDFVSKLGVRSEEYQSLKQRLGVDALGFADIANKLILFTQDRNINTIPEEVAHFVVMMMGTKNKAIFELIGNIQDWDKYESIKKQYLPIYKNEFQVDIEAVGKLISESLVKNYKVIGVKPNILQRAIQAIKDFIKDLFSNTIFVNELSRINQLADNISLSILKGDYGIFGDITPNQPKLNYEEALNNNQHAKNIIDTFTKLDAKLTGSLALAGQGDTVYRNSLEPIHDLDFVVYDKKDYSRIKRKLDSIGAIPLHFGWENKTRPDVVYAYVIPAEGFKIVTPSRDYLSSGKLTNFTLLDNKGNVVEPTSQNTMVVDFFVYDSEEALAKKESLKNKPFLPSQEIYSGKLSLSAIGSQERFFRRAKDQKDYILSTPTEFYPPSEAFTYYQLPSTQVKEGVPELFESNPELASIGTPEQYSQYLDTIFPDSKVKDIVYRGAEKGIENHRAYSHWTLRKALAENFVKQGVNLNKKDESQNTLYFALLNIKNLVRSIEITDKSLKEQGFDSAASFPNQQKPDGTYYDNEEANEAIQLIDKNLNNEITVFEPEQIHILGNKQDIEGFKKFVNQQIPSTMYSKEIQNQVISKYLQQEKVKDLVLELIDNVEYNELNPAQKSKYIQKLIFDKEIRPLESRKSVTIVDGYRVIVKPTDKTFRGTTKEQQYKNFRGYAYAIATNLNKTYAFTSEPATAKLEDLGDGTYELNLRVNSRYYENLIKFVDDVQKEALAAEIEAMQALEVLANVDVDFLNLMKESNTIVIDGEALPFDGQWFDSRFHTGLAVNNPQFEKFSKVINFLSTKFKGTTWSYNPYLDQVAKINLSTGEIMFNPNLMSSETPWHEFGHILVRSIRQNNPELFNELKKEVKDLHKDNPISSSYAIVKALYPEYGLSDSFWEEVITTELGKQADVEYRNKDSKTIWQKIYDYFKNLFSFEVNEKTNIGNLVDSLLSKEEVDLIERQYNPEFAQYMFSRFTSEDKGRMLKEAIELLPTDEQQTFGEKIKTLAEKITDKDLNAIRFSTQKLRLQGESKLLQESANSLDKIKDLVTKEDIAEAYYELANYLSTSNVHLRNVAQRIRENKENEELAPQIKLSALYFANQQAEAFERQINELRNMFSESAQKAIDSINTEQRQLRNNNVVFYNIKVIEDTIGIIKREADRGSLVPLSEELYSAIKKGMDDLRFELNEQIKNVKKEKISDQAKNQKIKEIEKRLAELPKGPEDIKKLLSDPNSKNNWFRQSFDSAFLTDTPTVRIVADYILKGMQGVMPELQKMNNRIQEIQERINRDNKDTFGAIIDRKKMYENYVREVEYFYVEENELKSIKVYALNTQTDTVALQNEITKLKFALSQATEESEKLELTKKINDFYKNYTERPFTDEYYEISESLPEDIAIARNQIYSKINSLREQIGIGNFDGNSLNDVLLIQDIKDLQSELDNMERLYDSKGNKKTGKALQDAEAIIKWKEDKKAKELVSYELTDASKQAFEIEYKKQFDAYQSNLSNATTDEERRVAQEAFDAWSSINVRTTYKQEFYDKRQRILDGISYYLKGRGDISKEYQELFNILKGQKDPSGVYIPSNYSKELIAKSKEVEQRIENIKQLMKEGSPLSKETKEKLLPLFKMLDELQSTAVSSYYTETKETIQNELRSEIVSKNPNISEEELNRQVHQQYINSQWYKDNHIIKNRWDSDTQTMVQVYEPLFVWRVTRPNNPDYVEKNQPGFSWYRAVVNPKFKNENYKQGQIQFKEVTSGPYYNKNYDSLTDNQKSIVNDLRAIHLENQKGLYAKDRLGDVIPGQLKTGNDRFVDIIKFRANPFSSWWTNVKTWAQGKNQQDADVEETYGEQESDFLQKEYGTDNLSKSRKIFMRFAKPLDVSKQSYDILGAIANYGGSSHQFRALRKMQAVVLSASEKTTAEVDKVQINNMIETLFYGQSLKAKGKVAKGFNTISRMATAAAGRKSLGYNLISIPQNLVTGLKQNLINVVSHGITLSSLRKGTVDATMASKDFFLYHSQLGNKPKSLQLLDYFGVEQKNSFFQGSNVTNTGFRKYGSIWRTVNTIREYTEFEIGAQVGFAYLNQYRVKLKDSDQTIPLKDAFELKDGVLQPRPDVELGKEFDNIVQYVRNKIFVAVRRSQGIYDSMSQPELNRYTLGKLMLFLKKWVLGDVKSIYGRSTIHYGAGFETEGSWSAFAQLIKDAYSYNGNIFAAYRTSSEAVKGGVVKSTLNAAIWYLMVNSLIALQRGTNCEEDGEADWADYACYFMKRIVNEVEGAFTLWGMNEAVYTYYIEQSNGISLADKLFGALSGPIGILGRYFKDFDDFTNMDPYYRLNQSKVDWDKTHPFLAGKPALVVGAIEYLGLRGIDISPQAMEFNNRRINDYMPKTYSTNLETRFKKDYELEKMPSRLPLPKLKRQFEKQIKILREKEKLNISSGRDNTETREKINNLISNYRKKRTEILKKGNVWDKQQFPFVPKVSIMGDISDKKIEKLNEDDLDN